MKVRISTVVDIDSKAWQREFGVEPERVREDVKTYFESLVRGQLDQIGLAADG